MFIINTLSIRVQLVSEGLSEPTKSFHVQRKIEKFFFFFKYSRRRTDSGVD